MKRLFVVGATATLLVVSGCSQNSYHAEHESSSSETHTSHVSSDNDSVVNELHEVMSEVEVEGRGFYQHENPAMARNIALNLAINDLAKAAGDVLTEEDSIISNDQVEMLIRTRARNIVQGYQVVVDHYDPATQQAEVLVRQQGERIASEMERHLSRQ